MRLIPDIDFEFIELKDNPMQSIWVGVDLSSRVKKGGIMWLKANVDLFTISPCEISSIDPNVVFHMLNIDHYAKYVLQRKRWWSLEKA